MLFFKNFFCSLKKTKQDNSVNVGQVTKHLKKKEKWKNEETWKRKSKKYEKLRRAHETFKGEICDKHELTNREGGMVNFSIEIKKHSLKYRIIC